MAHVREPLTMQDREDISRALAQGLENKDIAASIRRSESVVSREIARHGGREAYRAWKADAAARESRSRPKERKVDADPELRERLIGDLKKGWSPEQIAGRLRYEYNRGETDMSVSHEGIYTWIYAQPKGEPFFIRPLEIFIRPLEIGAGGAAACGCCRRSGVPPGVLSLLAMYPGRLFPAPRVAPARRGCE